MALVLTPWDSLAGKHFPLWVVRHFRKYYMEKAVEATTDEDMCANLAKESKKQRVLQLYQTFLAAYLSPPSATQGLLIYHGLGSGKTASAINIMQVLKTKQDYNFLILLPASLQRSWTKEMETWGFTEKVFMISTNAPNFFDQLLEQVKASDSTRKTCYVIDECHNFFHNVYSNIRSGGMKGRALSVYDFIINDVRSDPLNRVIALSGTPIRTHPYEVALLFNLLRQGSFPKEEETFESTFVKNGILASRTLFQRRIMGLVSYYRGDHPGLYAKRQVHEIVLPMSRTQEDVYTHFEKIEKKAEQRASTKGVMARGSFRTITRLVSNFAFDTKRPRPATFRLTPEEEVRVMQGRGNDSDTQVLNYLDVCTRYLQQIRKTVCKGSIRDDIAAFSDIHNISEFIASPERSASFKRLHEMSAKMVCAALLCASSPGKTVFYSNFVRMEGIEVFKLYLDMAGVTYVEFVGSMDREKRKVSLSSFNQGDVQVMLLSAAGSEGISLFNVRRVIILEPHWNEDVIQQVIGRAIRRCSHADLPPQERIVDVFRLKTTLNDGSPGTDTHVEMSALYRHALKQSFLEAMQSVAVDCDLFKSQNMNQFPCFHFSADEMLTKNPGPSYLKDITLDDPRDYGITRLRVKKILASPDSHTPAEHYYMDETTGILYDTEFSFPVGRVIKTEQDLFEKVSGDVYRLSDAVQI